MFLLELIYFLAAKKKKSHRNAELTSPLLIALAEMQVKGRRRLEPRVGHNSAFGLQMVKGKYQLEPSLRCWVPPLHNKGKNTCTIAHHVAFGWDELPIYNLLCLERSKLCSFQARIRNGNHSSLLVYKDRVRPKVRFPLLKALSLFPSPQCMVTHTPDRIY